MEVARPSSEVRPRKAGKNREQGGISSTTHLGRLWSWCLRETSHQMLQAMLDQMAQGCGEPAFTPNLQWVRPMVGEWSV